MLRLISQPRCFSKTGRTVPRNRMPTGKKHEAERSGSSSVEPFATHRSLLSSASFSSALDASEKSDLTCHHLTMSEVSRSSMQQREVMKNFFSMLQVTLSMASRDRRLYEFTDSWSSESNALPQSESRHKLEAQAQVVPLSMQRGYMDGNQIRQRSGMNSLHLSTEIIGDDEITVSSLRELEEAQLEPEQKQTRTPRLQKPPFAASPFETNISRALNSDLLSKVRRLFIESVEKGQRLNPNALTKLFKYLVKRDIACAYNVMCRYREQEGTPMEPRMYAVLCDAIGYERPRHVSSRDVTTMVKRLRGELEKLDVVKYQHVCYPRLVKSLVRQRDAYLGRGALAFYQDMVDGDFPGKEQTWEKCIVCSRYSRQHDLPYHDMLREIVESGRRPYPPHAIHVLQNLFPFTDIKATSVALQALLELQTSAQPSHRFQVYGVDSGTLEQITAAGARKASPELNLLVWDMLEVMGSQPTEAMYENTIQAFCMSYRQDHNVFAVLAEMESRGFKPTRALIRSISRSLRFSPGRTDHAYYMLKREDIDDSSNISVASLNAVLSACAEQGDVDRTFSSFDDFEVLGLDPDEDSFSFLLEALVNNAHNKLKRGDKEVTESIDAAESIVAMMKDFDISLSSHSLYRYVQLMCFAGDITRASEVVYDAIERRRRVPNKTLFILAKECGAAGQFDMARDIASKTSEPWDALNDKISRWAADFKRERTPDLAKE